MTDPVALPASLTTNCLNSPLDVRNKVNSSWLIQQILNPYVGMHIWISDLAELVIVTAIESNSGTFKKQYIRGILYNVFDAPNDGGIYSRINNQWVDISQYLFPIILLRFYYGYVLGSAISINILNINQDIVDTGLNNNTIKYMDIASSIGLLISNELLKLRSWLVVLVPLGYMVLRCVDSSETGTAVYGPFLLYLDGATVRSGSNGQKIVLIDNKTYKIYGQRWPYADGSGYSGTKFKVTRI